MYTRWRVLAVHVPSPIIIIIREITKLRHNLGPISKVRHTKIAAGLTDFKQKLTSQWLG
jgi:hypothetical protein